MLTIEVVCGRLRFGSHSLVTILLVAAATLWLGDAGTGLLALWGSATWPRWRRRAITVRLAEVREIWLYAAALVVRQWDGRLVWVFRDEMPVQEYSRVRRILKRQVEGLL